MDKRLAALGQTAHRNQQAWSVAARSSVTVQSSAIPGALYSFVAFSVQTLQGLHTQSFFCELIFGLKIIDGSGRIIAGNSEGGAAAGNS